LRSRPALRVPFSIDAVPQYPPAEAPKKAAAGIAATMDVFGPADLTPTATRARGRCWGLARGICALARGRARHPRGWRRDHWRALLPRFSKPPGKRTRQKPYTHSRWRDWFAALAKSRSSQTRRSHSLWPLLHFEDREGTIDSSAEFWVRYGWLSSRIEPRRYAGVIGGESFSESLWPTRR